MEGADLLHGPKLENADGERHLDGLFALLNAARRIVSAAESNVN
jgi:hypothetical protein